MADRRGKEKTAKKKEKTGLSVSDIILKEIEPPSDIWKDKLQEHFEKLEKDFPDKTRILEYMRLIIFNSMELSRELMHEYGLELKDGEEKGGKKELELEWTAV